MNFKIEFYESFEAMPNILRENLFKLHTEIFSQATTDELREDLLTRKDVSIFLIADQEGVAGFKIGNRQSFDCYNSWAGGVHPRARKKGLGAALMKAQHDWVKAKGYKKIQTKTKNKWKDMIVLNVRNGFDIIGAYTDEKGEPKLILEKNLS